MKHKLPWIFLGLSLICFICAGFLLWERYYNPYRLDFKTLPAYTVSKFNFLPARITIPDLKIDLPIIPDQITHGHWPTTPAGVSYLVDSARPGEEGNSIFYGHNWPRLLGSLYQIKPGALITVYSTSGSQVIYQVDRILKVSPDDTRVLANTLTKRLTLYTCTGFADFQRLVVIAYVQTGAK